MKIYQCTRCGKISLTIREANDHLLSEEAKANKCIANRSLRTIHLPLKAEWYEMIERGEKKEEYREVKPIWMKRLLKYWDCWGSMQDLLRCNKNSMLLFAEYDAVVFRYGYTKRFMVWSIDEICIGQGRTEWGAPENQETFIIKLKERLL